jgi:hypothetical protein
MFPGLTSGDFDCYEPRKWKSNVYNRERMEVRQKLQKLARDCRSGLLGSDGAPLHIEASVEHPAVWNHKQVDSQGVFFSRHEAARKELDLLMDRQKPISSLLDDPTPQRNHLFLAVTVTHEGLDAALKLHPDASIDRQNFVRKLDEHFEADRLIALLHELPEGFRIGVLPELRPVDAELSDEALRDIVDSLPPGSGSPGSTGNGGLGGLGGLGLLPGQPVPPPHLFYLGRSLPRAEAAALTAEEQEAWVREQLAWLLPVYRFIVWSRDNDFVSMRQVLDKEKTQRRQKGLSRHDKVRIVRGMLAGKDGLIQEVDAKGQLKVLVGKLVVKVDAADVER